MGRGAPGPPAEVKLVARLDRDHDKRLNPDERRAAREFLSASAGAMGRGRGRPGGPGGVMGRRHQA
jgi:hypothetical protein